MAALGHQDTELLFPTKMASSIQLKKTTNQLEEKVTKLFTIGSGSAYFSNTTLFDPEIDVGAYRSAVMVGEDVMRRTLMRYMFPPAFLMRPLNVNLFGLRTKIVIEETGNNQQLHTDFQPQIHKTASTFNTSLNGHSLIIPVTRNGCKLIVVDESHKVAWDPVDDKANHAALLDLLTKGKAKQVHVNYGSAIIFHGLLVHAGAAYTEKNDRIFTYIGTHASDIPQNALGIPFPEIFGLSEKYIHFRDPAYKRFR